MDMNRERLTTISHKAVSFPGTAKNCGVAILFQSSSVLDSVSRDDVGTTIMAVLNHQDLLFHIANIYRPNNKRDGLLFFSSHVPALRPDCPILLCGDFKTVLNPRLDRMNCQLSSPWAYNSPASLRTLMEMFELTDIWH